MNKREDSLDHLTAKVEVVRRRTEAQIEATRTTARNANYMLASVIVAALMHAVSTRQSQHVPCKPRPSIDEHLIGVR